MAKLTAQQIAGYVKAAGFPADQVATAVAVALAESGGNPRAVNNNRNGSVDYGLFQINTVHGSLLSQGDKFDPAANAKMAYTVWQRAGSKWSPWVVYNTGRYRTYLPQATLAAGASPAPPTAGDAPAPAPVDPAAAQRTALFDVATRWTSNGFWLRTGAFILGTVLMLFSLYRLTGVGTGVAAVVKTAARTRGVPV